MGLSRAFWQWFCPHQGKSIVVPIVGARPDDPGYEATFCCDCGKELRRSFIDNAGTETRKVS